MKYTEMGKTLHEKRRKGFRVWVLCVPLPSPRECFAADQHAGSAQVLHGSLLNVGIFDQTPAMVVFPISELPRSQREARPVPRGLHSSPCPSCGPAWCPQACSPRACWLCSCSFAGMSRLLSSLLLLPPGGCSAAVLVLVQAGMEGSACRGWQPRTDQPGAATGLGARLCFHATASNILVGIWCLARASPRLGWPGTARH